MNFMNPQMSIEIERATIHSQDEWQKALEEKIKLAMKKINRTFSKNEFEEAVNAGCSWRITLSGIDFKVKTV